MEMELKSREILAVVTHDLKNYIHCIRGYAKLISREGSAESKKECPSHGIESICESAEALLNNLTEDEAMEQGRLTMERVPVVLQDVVRESAKTFDAVCQIEGIDINLHLPEKPIRTMAPAVAKEAGSQMKKSCLRFILLILVESLLAHDPAKSFADITLTNGNWSSTLNCPAQVQLVTGGTGPSLACDGLAQAGNWSCDSSHLDQFTAAANNPAGGGGLGYRHWVGDGSYPPQCSITYCQQNGGGLHINFPSANEFWFRWYVRYAAGFQWSGLSYDKVIGIYTPGMSIIEFYGDQWRDYVDSTHMYLTPVGTGWFHTVAGGGAVSDGKWYEYEIHLKGGANGIFQIWDNDVLIGDFQNVLEPGPFTTFGLGINQSTPNNGGCVAVDYDDMAFSTTGHIGLLGSTPPAAQAPPAPPRGLTLK